MAFLLELELSQVRLRGHDHYWEVIRRLGKDGAAFTVKDVVGESNAHHATVDDFIKRLVRAEFLRQEGTRGEGRFAQKLFVLVHASRETPSLRRDGTPGQYGRARQQMWNVIRGPHGRSPLSAADLVMLAATEDTPIALGSAKEYLQRLEKAGYLQVVQKAAQHRLTRYRMRPAMNTGPMAPKLLRTRIVYDPNTRALAGTAVAEEDVA